jgi:hypothetical protein
MLQKIVSREGRGIQKNVRRRRLTLKDNEIERSSFVDRPLHPKNFNTKVRWIGIRVWNEEQFAYDDIVYWTPLDVAPPKNDPPLIYVTRATEL